MGTTDVIVHRLNELEKTKAEHEQRIRALEIAYAKLVGWAAGGAFVGGLVFQVVQAVLGH